MGEEIVSLAILEALPGKDEELISVLRELYTMMQAKGYSRDIVASRHFTPGPLLSHPPLEIGGDARGSAARS